MNSIITIYEKINAGWKDTGIIEGYYRENEKVILSSQNLEVKIYIN
jgi:hypothetical protein